MVDAKNLEIIKVPSDVLRKKSSPIELTENVKQVSVFYSDGSSNEYEVVRLRELDKTGKTLDEEILVYLIPVKKGKINIYAIKYHDVQIGYGERAYTKTYLGGKEHIFYYQNSKDSYAINYFNVGFGSMFKLKERMLAPLRNMFSDCKKGLEYLESDINPDNIDKKAIKAHEKMLKKEFKSLPEEKQKDLKTIHYYECFELNELINMYETCN